MRNCLQVFYGLRQNRHMNTYANMRFGMVAVAGEPQVIGGRKRVPYVCDCGATGWRRVDQLESSFSCGCVQRKKAADLSAKRLIDLVGKRFGRLLVVERVEDGAGRKPRWRCLCDCGGETATAGTNLSSGKSRSCGCARAEGVVIRSPEVRAAKNAAVKKRSREDAKFAIDARIRAQVHKNLRRLGSTKSNRLYETLGYTKEQLKERLHATMPAGFTWDDFLSGRLHIDHIIPLSKFNFKTMDDLDFRRAWALSNLQLMEDKKNIKKSNKLDAPFQPSLCF